MDVITTTTTNTTNAQPHTKTKTFMFATDIRTRAGLLERIMNVMTRFVRTAEFEYVNYANFATYCEEKLRIFNVDIAS